MAFAPEWLALREPADAAARSAELLESLPLHRPHDAPLRVLDLASGTGANLRYLAPRLAGAQQWLLVDHDPALLAALEAHTARWAAAHGYECRTERAVLRLRAGALDCEVRSRRLDLHGQLGELPLAGRPLVTASALLDLVSLPWLEALAQRCAQAQAAVLFALSYDGRIELEPHEPEDELVRALVNAHQLRDKGFGPDALGPAAAGGARRAFEACGYACRAERSDWRLGPGQAALQRALLDGWLHAACEIAPAERARLWRWHARRRAHLAAGCAAVRVGHRDFAAWPR